MDTYNSLSRERAGVRGLGTEEDRRCNDPGETTNPWLNSHSPLRHVDHVGVMAIGPTCKAAAHAPHRPSTPDRPPSTSPSDDDDARWAGPSVASVPAGFALFGSGPAGATASDFALFGSTSAAAGDPSAAKFALFGSEPPAASSSDFALFGGGPAGPSGASSAGFALFGSGSTAAGWASTTVMTGATDSPSSPSASRSLLAFFSAL